MGVDVSSFITGNEVRGRPYQVVNTIALRGVEIQGSPTAEQNSVSNALILYIVGLKSGEAWQGPQGHYCGLWGRTEVIPHI